MNAKQAKEKAQSVNTRLDTGQYSKIISSIEIAATRGLYGIFWYESLNTSVRDRLIQEGYQVSEPSFDRNEIMIAIRWA